MQKMQVSKKLLNLPKDAHCVSHFYILHMHGCKEDKGVLTL